MTTLRCLVTEDNIAARACVDAQVEQRCWCSKAPLAVVEVSAIALAGSRLAEQLSTLKNTAQAMLRKPVGDRYDGPALRKLRGLVAPAEVPLPASPTASPQRTVPPTKPAVYAVEGALAAPAKRVVPEPITPAEPAKESSMLVKNLSDDEVRRAFEESGGSINKTMEKLGTTSWSAVKKRVVALRLTDKAASQATPAAAPKLPRKLNGKKRPRSVADVAAKYAPIAQPGDVIQLLEHQLAHHQEQAGRCEKALAALRS